MDFNLWLGALGFIATIIFGVLSIYLFKRERYPGAITFIQEPLIGLFDSLVKNFSEISITYDNQAINQQIVFLKGYLLNTGSIDIKEEMIEENVELMLPKKFKLLSAKITDRSLGNKTTLTISSNNIISVNLGLFRKNEFISIEALIDVTLDNSTEPYLSKIPNEKIEFRHRIADTSKIKKRNTNLDLPNTLSFRNISAFIMFSMSVFIIPFAINSMSKTLAEIHYKIKGPKKDTLNAELIPKLNNVVEMKGLDKEFNKTMTIDSFYKSYYISAKVSPKGFKFFGAFVKEYYVDIFLVSLVSIGAIYFFFINFHFWKNFREIKKLRSTLNLSTKSHDIGVV